MPRDIGKQVHVHRGKRSRSARKQRALEAALRSAPSVGVRPAERTGRFFPNHDREVFSLEERVPDDPPVDDYWTGVGAYQEVCDRCRRPDENPGCHTCHGTYYIRTLYGRRS